MIKILPLRKTVLHTVLSDRLYYSAILGFNLYVTIGMVTDNTSNYIYILQVASDVFITCRKTLECQNFTTHLFI